MLSDPSGAAALAEALAKKTGGAPAAADILYVEDDDAWAALVDCWVGFLGLTIKRLRTTTEFKNYVRACRQLPRCLLLDVRLGSDNGLDLCDEIKRSPRLQAIPVIVLTGTRVPVVESLKHRALYCIRKSENAEAELRAAIRAVLDQQDRTQGVIDAGFLRLDGRTGRIFQYGELVATLDPGFFGAFRILVQAAPEPVSEGELYDAFLSRLAYRTDDPESAARGTLRNYVSRLRKILGDELGGRIHSVDGGYVFSPVRSISN